MRIRLLVGLFAATQHDYDSLASDKVKFPSVRLALTRGFSGQTARIETLPNMKRAGAHPCADMFLSKDGNH